MKRRVPIGLEGRGTNIIVVMSDLENELFDKSKIALKTR